MPKRKRSEEESSAHKVAKLLSTCHQSIHHALKIAKGHERQRQSKRLRDPETDPNKRARLQNEVVVLKSIDLNQIALTHLRSALLRIKSIAECERLPEEVKAPVPKPDLTEDEEKALHNVTSCLFARPEVKKETEKAIDLVGKALGVEVPEQKKGRVRQKDLEKLLEKEKNKDGEGASTKETTEKDAEENVTTTKPKEKVEKVAEDKKRKRETATTMNGGGQDSESDVDEMAEKEEQALAKLDELLGSSDDEPDLDEETIAAAKARNKAAKQSAADELDPMEITSGEEDEEGDYDMEDYDLGSDGDSEDNEISGGEDADASEDEGDSGSESSSFQGFSDHEYIGGFDPNVSDSSLSEFQTEASDSESDSESSAILSPPRKKKATAKAKATKIGDGVTILPTLMGGYISDSGSSASDIDIAPNSRKNRRGQRARQAIWEKKYKDQAKHLHKVNNKRDAGWDLKRGAVDPASAGKPWKVGIKNPLLEKDKQKEEAAEGQGENTNNNGGRTLLNNPRENARGGFGKGPARGGKAERPLNRKERRAMGIKTPVGPPGGGSHGGGGGGKPPAGMPPKKRDDEGPLHPSWEARKKAKEALLTAPFQGKKITFD